MGPITDLHQRWVRHCPNSDSAAPIVLAYAVNEELTWGQEAIPSKSITQLDESMNHASPLCAMQGNVNA